MKKPIIQFDLEKLRKENDELRIVLVEEGEDRIRDGIRTYLRTSHDSEWDTPLPDYSIWRHHDILDEIWHGLRLVKEYAPESHFSKQKTDDQLVEHYHKEVLEDYGLLDQESEE
ncbi:MAG: hypothetical protein KAS32_08380 [Candidatus Peribacteraceae bacterium]|nr:hypothetical protein [Candidatus Peribacteraceae bacterium]